MIDTKEYSGRNDLSSLDVHKLTNSIDGQFILW